MRRAFSPSCESRGPACREDRGPHVGLLEEASEGDRRSGERVPRKRFHRSAAAGERAGRTLGGQLLARTFAPKDRDGKAVRANPGGVRFTGHLAPPLAC
ncbi:hypothetical protein AAFF_G00013010 [Aldrovandia affinis]|uniref:Uncharacterized protein n=1 Tax=Aldrovandia affinis TaxID=143900 RepID=A0AAD7S707_9TELE|nr:hypothetical protein AAFF_G00013010 [Aldrovandia affinis]